MPRPKVKPENRQRSTRACVPCKASKIRCDAGTPCGPCSKRDRIPACVYLEPSRKRLRTDSTPTVGSDDALSPRTSAGRVDRSCAADGAKGKKRSPAVTSGEGASRLMESRMLLTSKGEKVYVGGSASLSFLQFLRQILRRCMGPTGFTEHRLKDSMLEVETMPNESPTDVIQPWEETSNMVQSYREASSGILDLYTVDEIGKFLKNHSPAGLSASVGQENSDARADQAALNVMIAIGCQCRGRKPTDNCSAVRYFNQAQRFAFEGLLCDPSLDLVRIFILMAFYMAQACRRNAAYMYTGIASKAACALGLHRRKQRQGLPEPEASTRWRIWKSLANLDTIVSAILGRPGSIINLSPDDILIDKLRYDHEASELDRTRGLASHAVFALCSHILELQQCLGNRSNVDIATAEDFLHRLHDWNESLPPELRRFGRDLDGPLGPSERELLMGATHASCLYYFTTIIVTRPFLVSHLVSTMSVQHIRVDKDPTTVSARRTTPSSEQPSQVADLAQACLDSAVFLAKTCHMAIFSSLHSNNMCVLKAWIFAAGLVLGFRKFVDAATATEPSAGQDEVDAAFGQATEVLARLAEASPQARHYHEILTSLDDAVRLRHAQRARERQGPPRHPGSTRYVTQIFTADIPDSSLASSPTTATIAPAGGPRLESAVESTGAYVDADGLGDFEIPDWGLGIDTWADIPLLSDNLYFDWGNEDEGMGFG